MKRLLIVLILALNFLNLKASEAAGGAGAPPEDAYKSIMKLIKSINRKTWDFLKKCKKENNNNCIFFSETDKFYIELDTLSPYPFMILSNDFMSSEKSYQKAILRTLVVLYNQAFEKAYLEMAPEEYELVLNLIKKVAPELYNIIRQTDPTGKMHIKRDPDHTQVSINIARDGLPLIMIGRNFLDEHHEDQIFTIAHELSHYVLEHIKITPEAKSAQLSGIEVAGFLPFIKTFKKSNSRVREYEADRYAILNFGINPEYGINCLKQIALKEGYEWHVSRRQFKSTHPEWGPRIAQLEQIKYDLNVGNLKSKREIFDWLAIANLYLSD